MHGQRRARVRARRPHPPTPRSSPSRRAARSGTRRSACCGSRCACWARRAPRGRAGGGANAIEASYAVIARAAGARGRAQRDQAAAVRRLSASDQPQRRDDPRRRLAVDGRRRVRDALPAGVLSPASPSPTLRARVEATVAAVARRRSAPPRRGALRRLPVRGLRAGGRRAADRRRSATPSRAYRGTRRRCSPRPRRPTRARSSSTAARRRSASARPPRTSTGWMSASTSRPSPRPHRRSRSSSPTGAGWRTPHEHLDHERRPRGPRALRLPRGRHAADRRRSAPRAPASRPTTAARTSTSRAASAARTSATGRPTSSRRSTSRSTATCTSASWSACTSRTSSVCRRLAELFPGPGDGLQERAAELGRRGGRERGQDRPRGDRPAGRDRVRPRVPRAHAADDDA